jgi:DnaJ-class molecular chaperone
LELQDYYATLGVPRTASQAEIKKAFRKLARESHPVRHRGVSCGDRLLFEIKVAIAVVSDPGKRA